MPRQDFYVTFGSDIDTFNAGLLKELKRTEQIIGNFEKSIGQIGAGAANSPLAKLLGQIEAAKSGGGSSTPQATEISRAVKSFSSDINKLVNALRTEQRGEPSLRNAPTQRGAEAVNLPRVAIDESAFGRVVEAVDRNVTATGRVEAAVDRLIAATGGRGAAAPRPDERLQPRTQAQWDALSNSRRNRLMNAGVTPEAYVTGQPLPRFRGAAANATPTPQGPRSVTDALTRLLTEVTGFRQDVRNRTGSHRTAKDDTNGKSTKAKTATAETAEAAAGGRQFASEEGRQAYLDQLKRTNPELAKMIAGEDKLSVAVHLVTREHLTAREAVDLLGNSYAKTRKQAEEMLSTALGGARLQSKASALAAEAEEQRQKLANRQAPQPEQVMLGPAAPTNREWKQMEGAQRAAVKAAEQEAAAVREATRVETAYAAVIGRVSGGARILVEELRRLRSMGAGDAEIARAQAAAYAQLDRELRAQGYTQASKRNPQIAAAFAGAGAPVTGNELKEVGRTAAVLNVSPASPAATTGTQEARQTGDRIGKAMGYQASTAVGQLLFGNTSPFARIAHTTGTFIVRNFAAGAVFGVTNALQESLRQGVETEAEFVRVSAALDATGRSSDGLRTRLQGLSQQYGVSLEGVYKTAAGLTGLFDATDTNNDQLVALTKVAVQLEMISGGALNAAEAMRSLASVTASYGDASASKIADVATVIQNQLGVNVEDTIEGVSRLAGETKEMGIGFEHAAAYVASIGKLTGQSGQAAGEQFSRILASLQTGKTQSVIGRALRTISIDATPALNAQHYDEVIQLLLEHYNELTKSQRTNVAVALGGSRQAAAINALLSDGAKVLDTATKATHASGDAQERAAAIADTLRNRMARAHTAVVNFFAALVRAHVLDAFGAILKVAVFALDEFNHGLALLQDFFDSSPFTSNIEQLALTVGGLALSFNLLAKAYRGFMAVAAGSAVVQRFAGGAALGGATKGAMAAEEGAATGAAGAGVVGPASNAALLGGLLARNRRNNPFRYYNPYQLRKQYPSSGTQFAVGADGVARTVPAYTAMAAPEIGSAARTFAVGAGGAAETVLIGSTAAAALPRGRLGRFYEARAASLGRRSVDYTDRAKDIAKRREALTTEIAARREAGLITSGELTSRAGLAARQGAATAAGAVTGKVSEGLSFMATNAGLVTGGLLAAGAALLAFKGGVDSFAKTAEAYDRVFKQYFGQPDPGKKMHTPEAEQQAAAFRGVLKENADQNSGFSGVLRSFTSNIMHPFTSAADVTAQNVGRIPVAEVDKLAHLNGVLERQLNKYTAGLKRAKPGDIQKSIAENNKNIELYALAIDARPDLSKAQKANILLQLTKVQDQMAKEGEQRVLVAEGLHAVDAMSSDQIANVGSMITAINGLGGHVRSSFQNIIKAYLQVNGFDSKGLVARDLQELSQNYTVEKIPRTTTTVVQKPASKPNLRPGDPAKGGSIAPFPTDSKGNIIPTDGNGDPIFGAITPGNNPRGVYRSNPGTRGDQTNTPVINGQATLPIAPTRTTTTTYDVIRTPLTYERRQALTRKTLEDALKTTNAAIVADKDNATKLAQDTANAISLGNQLGQAAQQGLQDQVDKANEAMAHAERGGHLGTAIAAGQRALAAIQALLKSGDISPWAAQAQTDQINTQIAQDRATKASRQYERIKLTTRNQFTLAQAELDAANASLRSLQNDPKATYDQIQSAQQRAQAAANAQQDLRIGASEGQASYQEFSNTARDDAVGLARNKIKDDRRRLRDMVAQGLKGTGEYYAQLQQIKQDQYTWADTLNDIISAQSNLSEAIADANGNTVKAAQIRAKQADRDLQKALRDSGGQNTAAVRTARATSVQAHAAARDAALQDELDTIDFNKQMGRITSATAIAELQHILDTEKLTKQQRRQVLLEIHGLQQDLVNQLTSSGFNIPGTVQLPTAYQVRRSLGIDHARTLVKNSIDDLTNTMKPNALTGANSTSSLLSAMNSVRDAVNAKGAQHISVDQKNSYHVPTAAVARQIADQIIGLINQQNGQHVRANTSTPRLVQTR